MSKIIILNNNNTNLSNLNKNTENLTQKNNTQAQTPNTKNNQNQKTSGFTPISEASKEKPVGNSPNIKNLVFDEKKNEINFTQSPRILKKSVRMNSTQNRLKRNYGFRKLGPYWVQAYDLDNDIHN